MCYKCTPLLALLSEVRLAGFELAWGTQIPWEPKLPSKSSPETPTLTLQGLGSQGAGTTIVLAFV
jgi:hypothetical protein